MDVEFFSDREPLRRGHRRWLLLLLLLLFASAAGITSWRFDQPPRATPTHATWLDPPRSDSSPIPRPEKKRPVRQAPSAVSETPTAPVLSAAHDSPRSLRERSNAQSVEKKAAHDSPQSLRERSNAPSVEKKPAAHERPAPPERHVVMGFKVKPDERGFTRLQYNRPREAVVDRAGDIKSLRGGDRLTLDLPGVGSRDFRVKQTHRGKQIASITAHGEGERRAMVYLERRGRDDVRGRVLLWDRMVSYAIWTDADGAVHIEQRHATSEICYKFPMPAEEGAAVLGGAVAEPIVPASDEPAITAALNAANRAGGLAVPVLSSRPSARAVIYIDFDGHTDNSGAWAGGATIVAAPFDLDGNTASFTAAERNRIVWAWRQAREDFLPFDINVTTDESAFHAAPVNRRIRAVVTGTNDAWPGAGGVAYVNSFTWANDVPCWVYNKGENAIGVTITHEVGHTLNLHHDGLGSKSYHTGHGTAPTSWGPIMGAPFSSYVTQWSKGDYANATQTQDDLAIITSNGFGHSADDHGDTRGTATTMVTGPGAVNEGVIERPGDVDLFSFTWLGGTLRIEASPRDSRVANLDIRARILNSGGGTVVNANPTGRLDVLINQNLAAGNYFLQIEGVGFGDPYGSPPDGYTDYGSLGFYAISHNITAAPPPSDLEVTRFVLVNADTNRDIRVLNDGDTVDLSTIGGSISVRADVSRGVESVVFGVDGNANFRVDSRAPYAIRGDSGGDYNPWNVALGKRAISATPYSQNRAGGRAGATKRITVNFIKGTPDPGISVTRFVLVNADTNRDIRVLNDGDTVDLSTIGGSISVRVDVSRGVESVVFGVDGNANFQLENHAPYAIRGDPGGNYNPWNVALGKRAISATPYSQDRAGGRAGAAKRITVNFVEGGGSEVVHAINVGGGAYTSADGTKYQADARFSGGFKSRGTNDAIAGTADDVLYQSARYGDFSYALPVKAGTYTVTLKFNELAFGQHNQRQFDVNIENAERISNLDLYAVAGHDRAYDRSFTVTVTDGTLNLLFLTDVNNAIVSAILVTK